MRTHRFLAGAAALILAALAYPADSPMAERPQKRAAAATREAPPPIAKRTLMTLRGEIVDYYCFIEKGARGPTHLECGVRCVAGDVCMGLYTTDDQLFMISVNHLRAMEPLSFRDIPDPFNKCRALISKTVDLTGYAMERKGQKLIEVMDVTPVAPRS